LKSVKAGFCSNPGETMKFCSFHARRLSQASAKEEWVRLKCSFLGLSVVIIHSTPLKTALGRRPEVWSLAKQATRLVRRLVFATALALVASLALQGSPEGERVWFRFNKAFINANYASGEALGSVRAQTWGAAGTVHPTKCGGSDGELHVGAKDTGLDLPASQTPISAKALGADADWGVVFELPDAKAGTLLCSTCIALK
jgi:hypothetical protein